VAAFVMATEAEYSNDVALDLLGQDGRHEAPRRAASEGVD